MRALDRFRDYTHARGRPGVAGTAGAIAVVATLVAQDAAAGPHVELEWQAPADCPTREAELDRIAGLPEAESAQDSGDVHAVVTVAWKGSAWHAHVHLETDEGIEDRVFEGESCEAVARATAVILLLAANSRRHVVGSRSAEASAAEGDAGPPPAGAPSPPSATAMPAPGNDVPTSQPIPGSRPTHPPAADHRGPRPSVASDNAVGAWHHELSADAGLVLDSATLHRVSAGAEVTVGWLTSLGAASLRLEGYAALYPSAAVHDIPSQFEEYPGRAEGGRFALSSYGVHACFTDFRGIRMGPCAGAELDWVDASAFGAATNQGGAARWAALTGSLLLSVHIISVLWVRVHLAAVVPISRPQFVVDVPAPSAPVVVMPPPPISVRGLIGLEANFF